MRLDSQTEAGRPHIEVERMVSDALCEVYGLETDPPDNPQSVVDRVFYHKTIAPVQRYVSRSTPSSIVEVKHRNKGPNGDVTSFRPGGRYFTSGYIIDTKKINFGIKLSHHLAVPCFIVVALDGPQFPAPNDPSANVVVAWQITHRADDGTMTVNFPRLCGERETQATVNGGRKVASVDYLPCDEMFILRDVTRAYRRMI